MQRRFHYAVTDAQLAGLYRGSANLRELYVPPLHSGEVAAPFTVGGQGPVSHGFCRVSGGDQSPGLYGAPLQVSTPWCDS